MCMHWLKYVRLKKKDRLKNMLGTRPEVAMLADIDESHSAISSVYSLSILNSHRVFHDLFKNYYS